MAHPRSKPLRPAVSDGGRVCLAAAAGASLFHLVLAVIGPLLVFDLTFGPGVQLGWFVAHVLAVAVGIGAVGFCISFVLAITLLPGAAIVARTIGARPDSLVCGVFFGGLVSMLAFGLWEIALAAYFKWPVGPVAGVLVMAGLIGQWGAAYAYPVAVRRAWRRDAVRTRWVFNLRAMLIGTAWIAVSLSALKLPGEYLGGVGPFVFLAMVVLPLGTWCVLGMVQRWPTAGDRWRRRLSRLADRAGKFSCPPDGRGLIPRMASRAARTSS